MSASSEPGAARIATERALTAIDAQNDVLHGILTIMADEALADADRLDRARAAGEEVGPLYGMTIALKDNVDVAGVPTTAASPFLQDNVATDDAFIVTRIKAAGAVIVGKANMHEWAIGPTGRSTQIPPAANAWNADHIPGGSSSGSGVTVAAGMCDLSIGSDTGGSVRLPAALNGITGLRPTLGLVSNRGSWPVSPAFDTLGPMARSAEDVARLLGVIAGHDRDDPWSVKADFADPLDGLDGKVEGLRIGVPRRWFWEQLHPDMAAAGEAMLDRLRELGAIVSDIDLGDGALSQELVAFNIILVDACEVHRERLEKHRDLFGKDLLARLDIGLARSGVEYATALHWVETWRHHLRGLFGSLDVIAMPTTPGPAPKIADDRDYLAKVRALVRNTYAWSAWGGPSLSVPCGFAADGLPLGMQFVGRHFEEALLLRLAHRYQKTSDFHLAVPPRAKSVVQ